MDSGSQSADAGVLTLSDLEQCSYWELWAIAKQYNVPLPEGTRKKDAVFAAVSQQLLQRGIIEMAGKEDSAMIESSDASVTDTLTESVDGEPAGAHVQGEQQHTRPVAVKSGGTPVIEVEGGPRLRELEVQREIEFLRLKNEECKLQQQREQREEEAHLASLRGRAATEPVAIASPAPQQQGDVSTPSSREMSSFDVSKQIALVPNFKEGEIDAFFNAFERIAITVRWPREIWSLLVQCKLVGKAQDICACLSVDESLDYGIVKAAILSGFELVPEAYRQNFRSSEKSHTQSYIEFAREKVTLFKKWCKASNAATYEQLCELIMLEEFKFCLPESIVMYLNERKVDSVAEAAVCADEFELTHRAVVASPGRELGPGRGRAAERYGKRESKNTPHAGGDKASGARECFYCHEIGHLIALCPMLARKNNQSTGESA